jgi:hypothetical protein
MAPSNDYLQDETVQTELAAHDAHLIKGSTTWFPGEDPQVHWDFNRAKEWELLSGYVGQYSDLQFRQGEVTLEEAVKATYGKTDEYLTNRLQGHLKPGSGFNHSLMNGEVCIVGPDGASLIRDNRRRLAEEVKQAANDEAEIQSAKKLVVQGKKATLGTKRALRIDPSAQEACEIIDRKTVEHLMNQGILSLGSGD